MEKKELKAEQPVAVAGLTLVPVVRVSLNSWQENGLTTFYGSKQPVSIVIISSSTEKAFNMNGEEISLERLAGKVAEIRRLLEVLPSSERRKGTLTELR